MEQNLKEALDWFTRLSNIENQNTISGEESQKIVQLYLKAKAEAERLRIIELINKTSR